MVNSGLKSRIQQLAQVAEAMDLVVLVWGPGTGGYEHYEKRQKIRSELERVFANSDVRYSEDPDLDAAIPGASDLRTHEKELWHLAACDVCVVLDRSSGAAAEVAHFCDSAHARKLVVLTHQQYEGSTSFTAELRRTLNQLFYSDDEYVSCSLVERVIARVRQVALAKLSGGVA